MRTIAKSNFKFFEFFKTNWLVLLGLIILSPIIYKYIISQYTDILSSQQQQKIQRDWDMSQTTKGEIELLKEIDPNELSSQPAKLLALAYGTYYLKRPLIGFEFLSFLNPDTWTENENDAYNILLGQSGTMNDSWNALKECYSRIYTKGRDLQTDSFNYLPSEMYNKINWN